MGGDGQFKKLPRENGRGSGLEYECKERTKGQWNRTSEEETKKKKEGGDEGRKGF